MKRFIVLTIGFSLSLHIYGQDRQAGEMTLEKDDAATRKNFSPYAGRNFPTLVLWGDTHLHTSNSLDARAFGVTLSPEDAYRFARGEEIIATHGERAYGPACHRSP